MGIKYEHTPIALYGKLGKKAGQATQLRREAEQRAADIRQIRQIQHSEAMAEFQANLDLQAEQRARQWELEKAEINSQFKLQEQLKTESILGERDLRKRIERLDSSEKAAEAYDLQYGPRELLNPERQAEYDKDMKAIKMKGHGITLPTAPRPTKAAALKRTDIDAAVKFLQEFEEKEAKAEKLWHPLAPEPTEAERRAAEYYRGIIEQIGMPKAQEVMPEAAIAKTYSIGDVIEVRGKRYRVVGYDTDGTPLLDLV